MELELHLGMGRQPKSAVGASDPSAGFALYLDFKNSLYRSGSTISTAPPELCGDPAFNGLGWWAADAGVAVTGGKGVWTATTGSLYKAVPLNIGTSYVVTYTIDSISGGSISVQGGTARAAPGTYTETIVAGFNYILFGGGGTTITAQIDNVSIKAVAGTVSTMPGYTYTRSGAKSELNGTASPVAFAANTPGIVPGIGYASRDTETNLETYSQAMGSRYLSAATVTSDTFVAPDGATTGDVIVATAAGTSYAQTLTNFTYTAAVYTSSVFVSKSAGSSSYAFLQIGAGTNFGANINKTTGALTNNDLSAVTAKYAIDCGTCWRLVCVYTAGAVTTGNLIIGPTDSSTMRAVTGAGSSIGVWQSQTILGNFPDGGPIIATTTAAASIGADALAVGVANATYTATYTFDDLSTQVISGVVIAAGTFTLPVNPTTLTRGLVQKLVFV